MRLALVSVIVLIARIATADRLVVKVVEVSGETAYVEPGRTAGLVPGTKVKFGARTLVVAEAADRTAAITLGRSHLSVGDAGIASIRARHAALTERMAAPRPLDELRDQWPPAQLPAASQHPQHVAFGEQPERGARVAVYGHAFGNVDRDGTGGQAEARVVSSFDLLAPPQGPLAADLDVAMRYFGSGFNARERTPVFVRAAQLRWGPDADPALALGRLRYAATSLGMLDGGRAAVRSGSFEIATFGGIVPDPVSGKPDTSVSRLGAELIFDRPSASWQPRIALAAHGSTWQGRVDERRLSLAASASHDHVFLDGWGELQWFAPDNPWGAHAIEITGAGASGEWREHGSHVGIDVTFMRPERSLRLAAALPPDWLCAHSPKPGEVPESCIGQDLWAAATASVGMRGAWWSLDAVGSVGQTHSIIEARDASGYVRGELRSASGRVFADGSGGHTINFDWQAVGVGAGTTLGHVDATLAYRPERLYYVASSGAYLMQSASADLHYAASRTFDLGVSAQGTRGVDREVLLLFATFAWRLL